MSTLRAPRNRTLTLSDVERDEYSRSLLRLQSPVETVPENSIIHGDIFSTLPHLPASFADLLFLDPPYNLRRQFGENSFQEMPVSEYGIWFESWFKPLLEKCRPSASVYVCCDWRSSGTIHAILEKHLIVRNRITWEREKGRGALKNWKNCLEDIFYCTMSDEFQFDLEKVKIKKRVIAPYRENNGDPRGWSAEEGEKFRFTHPSNLWTDITVPFWSMPENTDHPTQKPEKLVARIILASSRPGDLVLDPFLGSGTSAVAAKKLARKYIGIEKELDYCCIARKRLEIAETRPSIQGYDGVFLDRNL